MRLLVIDASDLTAPGEKKVPWRLHLVMELVILQLLSLQMTDRKTGEMLKNYEFAVGDVVTADCGYSHLKGALQAMTRNSSPATNPSLPSALDHCSSRWMWRWR